VQTTLYNEAQRVFDFLKSRGEIERLKNLDHLGIIRRAVEGAHQPRWEYIVLTMRLADLVKDHVPGAHLGARLDIDNHTEASSAVELFKVWLLLTNLGHLTWTFTAERALMEQIKASPRLRKELLAAMPDDPVRKYAARILRDEDVYSFYHLVAFVRLHDFSSETNYDAKWSAFLKSYCVSSERDQKLERLHRVLLFFRAPTDSAVYSLATNPAKGRFPFSGSVGRKI
jgi:hypothetical protein